MLGLFLIYFIGNSFYKLAEEFKKHKWGYAILGIACYYAFGVIFEIFLAVAFPLFVEELDNSNTWYLGLLSIPIGVAGCWGLRILLRNQWTKSKTTDEQILDADLIN